MLSPVCSNAVPLRLRATDALLGIAAALGVAALAAWAGWFGAAGVAVAGVLAAALVAPALARIDAAERRLPNALTVPALGVALACAVVAAVRGDWVGPLVGIVVGLVLVALWWIGGMGAGDVKLGAALALAVAPIAWWLPLAGIACAFVLGGAAGVVAKVRGSDAVAFGPWLLAGSAVALVLAAV